MRPHHSPAHTAKHSARRIVKKICLLGDNAVGKTSLVRKFVYDAFDDKYIATIGTKTTKREISLSYMGKDIQLVLMIWDILGQKEYRGVHKMGFEGTSGALLVCDLTRPETLGSLEGYWAPEIERVAGGIPLLFLGNKSDLHRDAKIGVRELSEVALAFDSICYLTSAKTGENVEHAFKTLGLNVMAGKMRTAKPEEKQSLTAAQALDKVITHFCKHYGQEHDFAMAVVRQQAQTVGIDVIRPRRESILALIERLGDADAEFKTRQEMIRLKAERRAFVEQIGG
ncbi:MAG: Rab family GTPase [Candidatus Thermoplasmatota archaeon]